MSAEPITIDETDELLRRDEALVSFFSLDDRLLIWFLRPGQTPLFRDEKLSNKDLSAIIARLRRSLGIRKPFDVLDSYELYKWLLQPFAVQLAGVRRLIIVPDEALLPVPFAALVTDIRGKAYATLAQAYKDGYAPSADDLRVEYPQLAWLVKQDYAISLLPSATSLRELRSVTRPRTVPPQLSEAEPFIGVGDPLLDGSGDERGGAMLLTRGGRVVDDIRKLPRLPGTRDELLADAKALGADPTTAVFTEERATKPAVMSLNEERLAKTKVLAFATHALIAGDLKGLTEPALVLTPPKQPSGQDDGLLALEDILSLNLGNSDWIILSACNTAAPGSSGEGLSGLVRAFFYAGAPSVLVSEWSVDDTATRQLMTNVLTSYAANRTMSRAEALQAGMRKLMSEQSKGDRAYFTHPFAWASFVIVGEGGSP